MGEKVKGLSSANWQLQISHRDVDCSMENIVNSVEINRACGQVGTWRRRGTTLPPTSSLWSPLHVSTLAFLHLVYFI